MIARITSAQVPPERVEESARWWQEAVGGLKGQVEGLQAAYLLADRQSGRGQGIALWDSQEAIEAAMPHIQGLLQQAGEYFSAQPQIEILEVVAQV